MPPFERKNQEPAQPQPPVLSQLLRENHQRTLTVVLRRLERAITRLEEQIALPSTQPMRLTRMVHTPDEQQRQVLEQLAQMLRQEIVELADDCQLETEMLDLSRVIQTEFNLLWSDLEETRPRNLNNYGPLPPQAKVLLEPRIARLIELTLMIASVVRRE